MTLRAVVFDIYKTLLEVLPPPSDAGRQWAERVEERFPSRGGPALEAFDAACRDVVAADHREARAAGVDYPEVYWPSVAARAYPALQTLEPTELDDFLDGHAQLTRTVRLMDGAAEVLRRLREEGVPMGILSNSQPYTLRELDRALNAAGLDRSCFESDWLLMSYQLGFSKPNPHLFRILAARAAARGIQPAQTLMVGDRVDNDIVPAKRQGWRTWRLTTEDPPGEAAGGWRALQQVLETKFRF